MCQLTEPSTSRFAIVPITDQQKESRTVSLIPYQVDKGNKGVDMRKRARNVTIQAWLVVSLMSAGARSQTIDDYFQQFRALDPDIQKQLGKKPECDNENTKQFWALLYAIHEQAEYQHKLRGKASLGFQGDRVDEIEDTIAPGSNSEQYKLQAGLDLARGFYPGEFKFTADVSVRLQEGDFQEDVTKFRIAYDYYSKPWLEYFVFGSRFTDNFMDIDQRYEVGFGTLVEWRPGRMDDPPEPNKLTLDEWPDPRREGSSPADAKGRNGLLEELKDWKDSENTENKTKPEWFQCYEALNSAGAAKTSIPTVAKNVYQLYKDAWHAEHHQHSRWRLALSGGLFAELERATLEIPVQGSDPVEATSERLAGEQRFRWSLRPTLEYHPTRHWKALVQYYYKGPLDQRRTNIPTATDPMNLVLDFRSEWEARLEFSVSDSEIGQPGDIGVTLLYRRYFDNAPPLFIGSDSAVFVAPDTHEIFSVLFNIKWK